MCVRYGHTSENFRKFSPLHWRISGNALRIPPPTDSPRDLLIVILILFVISCFTSGVRLRLRVGLREPRDSPLPERSTWRRSFDRGSHRFDPGSQCFLQSGHAPAPGPRRSHRPHQQCHPHRNSPLRASHRFDPGSNSSDENSRRFDRCPNGCLPRRYHLAELLRRRHSFTHERERRRTSRDTG
jgi:hypothetical protein